jgi:hypothetical protein
MSLAPSDRVRLITEIAHRLGTKSWSVIDLTLKEFSVPWSDSCRGSPEDYVIKMLENASDRSLIPLARHVGCEHLTATSESSPNCWIPCYFRLFISHLAKHREEAAEIKDQLYEYGISAFVAHNDIEPTTEWQNEIENAMATCDAMVALLRPEFHKSKWTDQEIGYAMGRRLLIITVRLGEDPYGFIGRFQAVSGSTLSSDVLAGRIFDLFKKNKRTKELAAIGLVSSFVASDSYARAKARATLLAKAEYWDKDLSNRCLVALHENKQIYQAFGVPDQLSKTLEQHEERHGSA